MHARPQSRSLTRTRTQPRGVAALVLAAVLVMVTVRQGEALPAVTTACSRGPSNVNLLCTTGQLVSAITFASYGTPTTCPSPTTSSCHSPNSLAVVSSLCLNTRACTISVSPSLFGGDPCSGTPSKFLALVYVCAAGTSGELLFVCSNSSLYCRFCLYLFSTRDF